MVSRSCAVVLLRTTYARIFNLFLKGKGSNSALQQCLHIFYQKVHSLKVFDSVWCSQWQFHKGSEAMRKRKQSHSEKHFTHSAAVLQVWVFLDPLLHGLVFFIGLKSFKAPFLKINYALGLV